MKHSSTRRRSTGLRYCTRCGAYYPPSAKWCLRCYDDDGHLRQPDQIVIQSEYPGVVRASALSTLAHRIQEAGRWPDLIEIAFNRRSANFPQSLAAACWGLMYAGIDRGDQEIEAQAAQYLQQLFGVSVDLSEQSLALSAEDMAWLNMRCAETEQGEQYDSSTEGHW